MRRRPSNRYTTGRIDGSLWEVPIGRLLAAAAEQRITGLLHINSWSRAGVIELRAGVVVDALFDSVMGDQAMSELSALRDGTFSLVPRVPAVPGAEHAAGVLLGDLGITSLGVILAACRQDAATCIIEIDAGQLPMDQAATGHIQGVTSNAPVEIVVRGGELVTISRGGYALQADELSGVHAGRFAIRPLPMFLDGERPVPERPAPRPTPAPPRRKPASVPPPIPPARQRKPAPKEAQPSVPPRPMLVTAPAGAPTPTPWTIPSYQPFQGFAAHRLATADHTITSTTLIRPGGVVSPAIVLVLLTLMILAGIMATRW